MGSRLGVIRATAKRLGVTFEEYVARIEVGEKWCTKGKHWGPRAGFHADPSRVDGHAATCSACRASPRVVGPRRDERRAKRALGLEWCSACSAFLPTTEVHAGKCLAHRREYARRHYAECEHVRLTARQKAHARKRGVDPIPAHAQIDILEQFDGLCAYCRERPATTWDHIVPISDGGRTTPGNVAPACASCNSSKGNRDLDMWMAKKGFTFCDALIERIVLSFAGLYG